MGGRGANEPVFANRLGHPITRFGIHTVVERYTLRICAKFPVLATKRVSPHSIRHYVASRTISGKFGFGPFFGHISRFTGYIVLTASTTPAWGHEPSTVCRRQANSSATISEGLVASAHWPIARNHCVSSGIPALNRRTRLLSSLLVKLCWVIGGSCARLDPVFPMKSVGASELRYVVREAT